MANNKSIVAPRVVDIKSMTSTKNCEHQEHNEEKKWEGEQKEKEKKKKEKKIIKP